MALQQLLEIGKERDLEYSLVAPLLEPRNLRPLIPFSWHRPGGVAAVLAAGGPGVDSAVFARLKTIWESEKGAHGIYCLVEALALARHPDSQVTESLASMAASARQGSVRRSMLALALAARGDSREDWLGDVARALPSQRPAASRWSLPGMLSRLAGRLKAAPALSEALLVEAQVGAETDLARIEFLLAFSALTPRPVDREKWLRARGVMDQIVFDFSMGEALTMLTMRTLGRSPPEELREALALMAFFENHTDGFDLKFVAEAIVGEPDLAEIGAALGSGPWRVRAGALRLLWFVGPRARALLPAVDKLVSDDDPLVSSRAVAARVILGGLDESGDLSLGGGSLAELVMRAEKLSIGRWMETPSPARDKAMAEARAAAARWDREHAAQGEAGDP